MTAQSRIYPDAFATPRAAALALLVAVDTLDRREGQFLGTVATQTHELSKRQLDWLVGLLRRHNLPPLAGGEHG